MPIKISVIDDFSSIFRGTRKLGEEFEKVADSLDDVARDAQRAGDDVGRGLERGVAGASDSADRLERTFADMARDTQRSAKRTGDDLGDGIRDGARKAGRALDDLGDEADDSFDRVREKGREAADELGQTGREAAASFSGGFDDVADLAQEALANVPAALGPIGLAAGVAAGAGAGVFLTQWQEAAEAAEQRMTDMYNDFLESGADYLSKEFISQEIAKIYEGAPEALIKVKELRDMAAAADIPEPLLARALVGDAASRAEVSTQIAAKRLEASTAIDEAFAKGRSATPWTELLSQLDRVQDQLDKTGDAASTAQSNADAARAAIAGIDASNAARSADEARAKFDGLGREIEELPSSKTITARVIADMSDVDRQLARQRTLRINPTYVSQPV